MASPLDNLFDLRPGEGRQVVRVGSAFSAILAAHTILETARDAMFLTKLPPSRLAIVYAAMAVISLIAIALNTRMVRRLGRRNALIATLMASAYGTTLFYVAHAGAVAVAGLYLWAGLLGTLTIVQYWLLAGQLFTVTQGKRLFGPIAAIGAMGAFAGAWSASALLMKVSVQQLLPVSAGLYLLAAGLLTLGADGPAVAPPELRSQAEQTRSAMTHLRDQPYVRRLATLVALVTAAALVADYLFKASASLAIETERLPGFFARYYGVVAAVSLLLQLLGTGWLVKRMGVLASLTLLPLALLMGSAATVLLGGIFTAVVLTKGADGTLRNSVNRVSTEVLWMPLAPAVREAAREPIDSVLMRVVQAVTALALFGLAFTGRDTPVVLAAVLGGFAAAWLVAAVSLRSLYLDKLRQALARPAFDADQDLDLTSAEVVVEALSSSDPKRVTAAIGLLAAHNRTRLIPALILHHESPEVLRAALDVVASPDRRDWVPLASKLLTHTEAPVRTAAVRALARAGQALPMASLLADADPAVRAHATFWQARASGGDPAEDPRVREVITDDSATGRAAKLALLEALRDDGDTAWTGVVAELLRHGDAAVLEQAAQAVERVPDPRFLPVLIERLGVRTGRASVRAALVRVGEPALDALQAAYTDTATPIRVRLHLPKTIAMFGSQRACDFLLSRIGGDGDGAIRYRALRALVRLVVHNPVQVDRRPVLIEMQSNLREHFRTLALMRALGQGGKAGTGDGGQLIRGLLDDKQKQAMDRVFLLLQIAHRNEDVGGLRAALDSPDRTVRAHALEFLDALTRSPTYARTEAAGLQELLLLAVDDHPDDEKLARAAEVADAPSGPREALARLLRDGDEVVAAIAAFHALELGEVVLRDDVLEVARERPILEPLGFAAQALGVPVERDRDRDSVPPPTGAREQEGLTALFERELMVRSGLLEFATPAQIGQLVALVRDAVFLQGTVLYRRGEPADRVFILTDGRVELTAPAASAWRFGAGAGLGILDAVLVRPYARTATALSDVRALEVKADDYFDFLQDNIELGESLVTTFAMALHKAVLALPEPEVLLRSIGKPLLAEGERGLSMVERLLLVRRMRPFQRASVQSLVSLAQHAREVRMHAGDVLFKEGDRSDVVWMVARGTVEIRRRNPSLRAPRGAGDLVEHYAALCTGERQFTATATADTILLQIDREELLDRMEEHFDLVRSILAFLAGEREKLNEALVADRRSLLLSRG